GKNGGGRTVHVHHAGRYVEVRVLGQQRARDAVQVRRRDLGEVDGVRDVVRHRFTVGDERGDVRNDEVGIDRVEAVLRNRRGERRLGLRRRYRPIDRAITRSERATL